jgi:hypothetical protein
MTIGELFETDTGGEVGAVRTATGKLSIISAYCH